MHLKPLTLALIPVLAFLAALARPAVSLASCAMTPDIKSAAGSAEIAFVGTVTATANRDSWATVTVEEIWRGPDQPVEVVVKGGPAGNAATSVDRTFEVGVRYLFFPYADETAGLSDNSCTATTPWSADLAAIRPASAHAPSAAPATTTGFDFGGILAPLIVALIVGAVLLIVGLAARGRQTA